MPAADDIIDAVETPKRIPRRKLSFGMNMSQDVAKMRATPTATSTKRIFEENTDSPRGGESKSS